MTLGYFRDYKKHIITVTVSDEDQKVFKKLLKKLSYLKAGGHRWHTDISNYDQFIKDIQLFPGVADNTKTEQEFEQEYILREAAKKYQKKKPIKARQNEPTSEAEDSDNDEPLISLREISIRPSDELNDVRVEPEPIQVDSLEDEQPVVEHKESEPIYISSELADYKDKLQAAYVQVKQADAKNEQLELQLSQMKQQIEDLELCSSRYRSENEQLRLIKEQLEASLMDQFERSSKEGPLEVDQRRLKPTIQEEREMMRGSMQARTYNKSSNSDKIDYYKQLGKVHLSDIDEPSSSDEEEEDDHYMERPKPKQRRNREDVDQLRRKIQELEVRKR